MVSEWSSLDFFRMNFDKIHGMLIASKSVKSSCFSTSLPKIFHSLAAPETGRFCFGANPIKTWPLWKQGGFLFDNMNDTFYKSKRWLRKRENILRRDKYLCQYCKRYGRRREAVTVHHIKHYEEYPELALTDSNLISLCQACHNKCHPEKGGKRWWIKRKFYLFATKENAASAGRTATIQRTSNTPKTLNFLAAFILKERKN